MISLFATKQGRIHDFRRMGANSPVGVANILSKFLENYMKLRNFGLWGGGGARAGAPP